MAFPRPLRDDNGERLYPPSRSSSRGHIRRLLDAGWRPGRIVGLSMEELQRWASSRAARRSRRPNRP